MRCFLSGRIRLVLLLAVALAAVAAVSAAAAPQAVNGQITFARFNPDLGDSQVYVVNPDGSGERPVQGPTDTFECPMWSPDGTGISGCGGGGPGCVAQILNPDNGISRCVPSNPAEANLGLPCGWWSSDGTRLYCESFGNPDPSLNGIYSVRTSDGGDLRRVTTNPGADDTPGDASPTGDRLVFTRNDQNFNSVGLFVVNSNGTGLKQITPSSLVGLLTAGGNWSPQGNQIVFSAQASGDVASTLWVVHSDGSGLHQIPVAGCGGAFTSSDWNYCAQPVWSPDGTKIALSRFSSGTFEENIYTVNADGSGLFQVTHGGNDDGPDWGTHPLAQ